MLIESGSLSINVSRGVLRSLQRIAEIDSIGSIELLIYGINFFLSLWGLVNTRENLLFGLPVEGWQQVPR